MVATDYNLDLGVFVRHDPRLGRNVNHDSRSRSFAVEAAPVAELASVRHQAHIETLDQGQLGSCTGDAAVLCVSMGGLWTAPVAGALASTGTAANQEYAVGVYSDATRLDPFPGSYLPTDTGSDGLSVAKVLTARELISGYRHAFGLQQALTALAGTAVIVGTSWRAAMTMPDRTGRIIPAGRVEGGHEYCLDELDVENQRVWMHNSWGPGWGVEGRAWLAWDDLGTLLDDRGDVTVFVPATDLPPQPLPVDPQADFAAAATAWVDLRHRSKVNQDFERAIERYLAWLEAR